MKDMQDQEPGPISICTGPWALSERWLRGFMKEISPLTCHLRIMRSKMKHLFPAFLLLLWSSGTVMGQFVNIRLELPAGVQFEPQLVKTNLRSHGEEIIWMKMAAQENITFILSWSHIGSA